MSDPTPPLTVEDFRETFGTAFADPQRYPGGQVQLYLTLAIALLDVGRWADLLPMGLSMFVAHNLTLDKIAERQAEAGGVPTGQSGPIASKSVGPASVSYDTSSGIELDAGHFNMTTYGRRFVSTARIVGMGGDHIGGSSPLGRSWFPGGASWPQRF